MREAETRQETFKAKCEELRLREEFVKKLELKIGELQEKIAENNEQMKKVSLQAKYAQDRASNEHKTATEAVRKQLALEETVRYLTQQKDQIQERYQSEFQNMKAGFATQLENA